MNIVDMLKLAKVAWQDEAEVKKLIAAAKATEGPKPSYQTGEFWVNMVLPVLGGMIGTAATVFSAPAIAPYFIVATGVIALGGYLGRQWLKGKHITANGSFDLTDPAVVSQISEVVKTISATVSAVKDATKGNLDTVKTLTETLNAPTTVNVTTAPPAAPQA